MRSFRMETKETKEVCSFPTVKISRFLSLLGKTTSFPVRFLFVSVRFLFPVYIQETRKRSCFRIISGSSINPVLERKKYASISP